jgi:hypothetical protein
MTRIGARSVVASAGKRPQSPESSYVVQDRGQRQRRREMPETLLIVLVLLSASLAAGAVFAYFLFQRYKDLYYGLRENYDELLDRALEAERMYGSVSQEYSYLKESFQQALNLFQNRQSVAVMTDAQVQLISQTIASLVQATAKNPNQLN